MNDQAAMMNQQQQQRLMNLNQNVMGMNQMNPQSQQQVLPMNRGYGIWTQPPPQPSFQNPGAMKPPLPSFKKPLGPRSNWKGKKVNKQPNGKRRNEQQKPLMAAGGSGAGGISGGLNTTAFDGIPNFNNYQPPTLNELQHQNQMKTRKFFPKKKFNNKNTGMNMNMNTNPIAGNYNFSNSRSAPFAPRNTTSFLIRAKKRGGIASVSPSPVTPSVLPTPIFSPSREVLVDMAKEEWGVDGYGSMKGLIRLRSPGHEMEAHEDEEEDEDGSSESDVEEHVEMERRLEHDLSRFEMIYNPSSVNVGNVDYHNVLENRVDDQDSHIAHLEEENLTFKERLFLMERELGDLRRRMQYLERRRNNKEVVENESENESGSREEDNNVEFSEENNGYGGVFGFGKEGEDDKNGKVSDVEGKEGNDDVRFVVTNDKKDSVVDFENKDDVIAEADNGEGKDNSNDNNECVRAKDREENNHRENECPNMGVAEDDTNTECPNMGVAEEDTNTECPNMGVAEEDTNTVSLMDVGN